MPEESPITELKPSPYCEMISEICQEESIELRWFSEYWLGYLRKDGKIRQILGYKFDLNAAAASMVAEDKSHTYSLLSSAQVPAIPHQVFYEEGNQAPYVQDRNTLAYLENYFTKHNSDIVLKPNGEYATGGHQVFHLTTMDEASEYLRQIFHQHTSASLSPFYKLKAEYRVVLLDGEPRLAYRKEAGKDWRFNLQNGAKARDIEDKKLLEQLVDLAKRAVKVLNLRFCSIDIVEPIRPTDDQDLLVLEANSGVMILNYLNLFPERRQLVKDIYRDAIRKMFES